MPESKSMVRWTFAMAVASWVAAGAAIWGVQSQREDARELLQAQIGAELGKPWLHIHPGVDWRETLADWLRATPIRTLNVAGPRLSNEPNVGAFVWQVLDEVYLQPGLEVT